MKRITLLGATGSIARSTLDVVRTHREDFRIVALAVKSNARAALDVAKEFGCSAMAVEDSSAAAEISEAARFEGVRVYSGPDAARDVVDAVETDLVLVATVGFSGLKPTLAAIDRGYTVALATKEVLVAAGEAVMARAVEKGVDILPVDSEHSAIFQCLQRRAPDASSRNGFGRDVDGLVLTASGGPFLDSPASLDEVTPEMALEHPRWKMGAKVTIDSATMMNKGFEIMEARWLFDCPVSRISVVVHPESVVHSMVTFTDGATLAQLSPPDMRVPVQYALTWPGRIASSRRPLDLCTLGSLTFRTPDEVRFPCLALARTAAEIGGTMPAILAAADEVAVARFLSGELPFTGIAKLVSSVMKSAPFTPSASLDAVFAADEAARSIAREFKA